MNPMRRAVVRAAVSASRVPATKTSMLGVASQISVAAVARIVAPVSARCFSQTLRVALNDGDSSHGSQASEQQTEAEPGYGLFIRNMVFEANEDHLREAYEKFGTITKVAIARDARGLSRGYGFVWFDNQQSMEKAVAGTNSSFWHGRRIQVAPRAPRSESRGSANRPSIGPTKSLYIGNIPYETTDAELNQIFRDLPKVTDVRVAVDRTTGWPRGFAHADFVDVDSASEARDKLQSVSIGGRRLRVDYAGEVQKRTAGASNDFSSSSQ